MTTSEGARGSGTAHDQATATDAGDLADRDVAAAVLDSSHCVVCVFDVDGRIVRFNRACEEMTGFSSAEVLGRDARAVVIPLEDSEQFAAALRDVRQGRELRARPARWLTKDGRRRVIAWDWRPSFDDAGEVRLVVASGLDVTDRESAASELWAVQSELRERLVELGRLADEQAALRRVATLVAREPAARAVFEAVTEETGRVLAAQSSALLCYDQDGRTARIVGRWTQGDTGGFPVGTVLPIEAGSLMQTVRETRRAGRVDDYSNRPGQVAARLRAFGYRSLAAAPVIVAGRVWGLLVLATQREEPLPAGAELRLENFAELVALALASADARDELAASRARIVEASDEARRRLERDLHDGAQQRLVAASLTLRLARARADRDPGAAATLLDQGREQLGQGLEQLRELARGIHPALLTHRGLRAGIEALVARAAFAVDVDVPDERFGEAVEVAVYYVVSEALANAAKHAQASHVTVSVRADGDRIVAEIADDGAGGADPAGGSGLRGLADRVTALGGRLDVDSPPGGGTRVRADLPRS